ncbi:MAG: hypothetical protein ACYTKD_23895 [Planctomycetota bacterium]|jgi:hypothetical protein
MPLARGSHDYLGVQMTAVEECVDDVRGRYPVSALYVMGASMGGMGAWLYAERHALDVAGISPWCGNADSAAWQGVWEPPRPAPRSPAGRAWRMVRESRALAGLGPDLRFDVMTGRGHRLPAMYEERMAWLADRRPPGSRGPKRRSVAVVPPLAFVGDLAGVPSHRAFAPLKPARFAFAPGEPSLSDNSNAECEPGDGPSKWHYPGPACVAFEHAFAVALPGRAPAHLAACADELSEVWRARCRGEVRRTTDARGFDFFGPRDDKHLRTLVALGSPDENAIVRDALDGLDVQVATGRARLFGRDFSGDDVALVMLRPRAAEDDDPRAAALVVWGSSPASYRQVWRRFAHTVDWEGDRGRWWFDYAVFDRRTSGPDTFLAVGYFDHEWRFEDSLMFEGSPELRSETPGAHWPPDGARDSEKWGIHFTQVAPTPCGSASCRLSRPW